MSILRDSEKRKKVIATIGTTVLAVNSLTGLALADGEQSNTLDELNNSSNVILVEGGIEEVQRLEEEYMKSQQEAQAKAEAEAKEAQAKAEAEKAKKLQEQKDAEEKDKNIFEKVIDILIPEKEDEPITENKEVNKASNNQTPSKNETVEGNNSSDNKESNPKSEDNSTESVTPEEFDQAVSGGATNNESDKKDDVVTKEEFDQAVSGGATNNESDKKDNVVTKEEFDQAVSGGATNNESDKKGDVVTKEEFDQAVSGGATNNESDKKDDVVTKEEFDQAIEANKGNSSTGAINNATENTSNSKENKKEDKSNVDKGSIVKKEEDVYADGFWDLLFESLAPSRRKENIQMITTSPKLIDPVNAASNGSNASNTGKVPSNTNESKQVSDSNADNKGSSKESSTKEANASSNSDTKNETKEATSLSKHGYPIMTKDEMLKAIDEACEKYNVNPALAKGQAMQESKFDQDALSYAGAAGVMQLMPGTAKSLGLTVNDKIDERWDPKKNIDAGVKYIAECERLSQHYFKQVSNNLILSIYNAGIGNVLNHGVENVLKNNGVPDIAETKDYVEKVTNYMKDFK